MIDNSDAGAVDWTYNDVLKYMIDWMNDGHERRLRHRLKEVIRPTLWVEHRAERSGVTAHDLFDLAVIRAWWEDEEGVKEIRLPEYEELTNEISRMAKTGGRYPVTHVDSLITADLRHIEMAGYSGPSIAGADQYTLTRDESGQLTVVHSQLRWIS